MRRQGQERWRLWGRFIGVCGMLLFAQTGRAQNTALPANAVMVNGEAITTAEFFGRLQIIRAQDFITSVSPLTVRQEFSGQIILDSLINERLILQWATKTKDLPTEDEVTEEVANLKKQPLIQQALTDGLLVDDNLRYDVRVQRSRFNIATAAITLSPAELDAYYKKNIARFSTPERWGLSVIRTTKRANLLKIGELLRTGKPFGEIAKTYSDDANSKNKNGEIGVVNSTDAGLPAPLKEAVKKLKLNEVSPPVKIDFPQGAVWYFVRLTAREPGTVTPLADIKKVVERQAMLERAGGYGAADKKIREYRQSAKIEIIIPGYQSLLTRPVLKPEK